MTAEAAVSKLVQSGAALTPMPGGAPVPVGLMRRMDALRWFWWAAGGDTEFDGHVIQSDRVRVLYDGMAVTFQMGEMMVGYLTTLEEAIDEPTALEAAKRSIARWHRQYDADAALRGFIERRIKAML